MKKLSFSIAINLLTENFKKGTDSVKGYLRSIQMQIITFAAALGLGGAGLMGLISRLKDVARETSRALTSLRNVSASTSQYADNIRFLNNLAKQYGIEINTLVSNYARFKAAGDSVGMSLLDQRKIFESVSRASVAYGMSAEDTNLTFLAITQMMSKGKISSEELRRQLGERLPIAMAAMAKAAGVPINKLDDLLKKGKLLSADVLPKFADALNEMIPNVNTDNIETSLNRLSNVFNKFTAATGFGEKYKVAIDGLSGLIEKATNNISNIIVGIVAAIVFVVMAGLTKVWRGYQLTGDQIIASSQAANTKMVAATAARVEAEVALEKAKSAAFFATDKQRLQASKDVAKAETTLRSRVEAEAKAIEAAKLADAKAAAIKTSGFWATSGAMIKNVFLKLGSTIKYVWNMFAPAIIFSSIIAIAGFIKNAYDETKKLQRATEDYNKEAATEQSNIDILFNKLRKATEGTEKYNKIKDEIIGKYGSYLKGLSDEITSLKDVEGAYKAISKAALQSARDRAIEKNSTEAYDKYTTSFGTNATELQDRLSKKYGKTQGAGLYDTIISSINSGQEIPKSIQKLIDTFNTTYYGSSATGGGSSSNNPVQQLVNNIKASKKELNKELEDIKSIFGEKSGQDLVEDITKTQTPDPDDKSKTADKIADAKRKLEEADRQRQIDKIAFDNEMAQRSVDNMEDGFSKEFAQLEQNHKKEIQEIKDFEKNKEEAQREEIKKKYIVKHGNAKPSEFDPYFSTLQKKGFKDKSGASVLPEGLRPEDITNQVKQLTDAADAAYTAGTIKLNRDLATFRDEERLRFASDLDKQLYDISKYYAERRRIALKDKKDITLINENEGKETRAVVLQSLGKQLEFEMQYNQKAMDLVNDRYAFESDKRIASIKQQIADQQKIVDKDQELANLLPDNEELANKLKESRLQLALFNKELDRTKTQKFAELANTAAEIASELRGALGDFGVKLSDDTNKALDGFESILKGAGDLAEGIATKNPAKIISGAIEQTKGYFNAISGIMGSADYSGYDKLKAKYENLLEIWNELIDKKKEYLSTSAADEVNRTEKEILDMIKNQEETARKLAQARLDAGKSAGSHSLWYRMWKGSYKFDGKNWQDVAGSISKELGVSFKSMSDMLNMSADQLQWIKENYSGLWAVMDGDFRGYLEQLITYGDNAKEVISQAKEVLTGVSFDSLQDSFLNTLLDMDSDAKDFADNFSGYLQKAILKAMLEKTYAKRLEDWYNSFAEANRDGNIDKSEYNRLQNEWNGIVNDSLSERNKLKDLFGWQSGSYSQDSSRGSYESITQDQAGAIDGRLTGLLEVGLDLKGLGERMESLLSGISLKTSSTFIQGASINAELVKQTELLSEINQTQRGSYFFLEELKDGISKLNGVTAEKLASIEKNTKELKR